MSGTFDIRRLSQTPVRDLMRGRVTGRLDWLRRIEAAGLPVEAREMITRVVRRTRLWRSERAEVADELIAHFADGLASGESGESMVEAFGEEHAAAKLIRRAKRRNRSLVWRVSRYAVAALLLVVLTYGVLFARFWFSRPKIAVDYLAQMNVAIERVPADQRGWPLYRQAMLQLGIAESRRDAAIDRMIDADIAQNATGERTLLEATPADKDWPELVAWLDAHADGIATLRAAAAKRTLGFVLGPGGSEDDPELGWNFRHLGRPTRTADFALDRVPHPHLGPLSHLATVLRADSHAALAADDARRYSEDIAALMNMATQLRDTPGLQGWIRISLIRDISEDLEASLRSKPGLLSRAQLIILAHQLAGLGGETASSLIDFNVDRLEFRDTLQRLYTDDGHGDGVVSAEGLSHFAVSLPKIQFNPRRGGNGWNAFAAGALSAASSRRAATDEYERLVALLESQLSMPLRDVDFEQGPIAQVKRRLKEIEASPALTARYFPLTILLPGESAGYVERVLGEREGVVIGIALELYRRDHHRYPESLASLTPTLLPKLYDDRIAGGPVRYRLIDGAPVLYSVGVDRDDDGGRAAINPRGGAPDRRFAARWQQPARGGPIDGDWILFDGRAEKPMPPATRPSSTPS